MTGGLGLTLLAGLAFALVLGAIALRLRLAPMIGYIAAGLLVGPFTPGFVANREDVLGLAEIGVALLMFSLGLQFNIRELAAVGRLVTIGTPIQVAITVGLGTLAGLVLGWPLLTAFGVGTVVSVCSTVVLVKVAGEAALAGTPHGRLAIGWSIVQDLLTVVLVVALSALGGESESPLVDALVASVLAIGFVAAAAFGGARILPPLLAQVARLGSRELFVIAVAVLAVGTALLADQLGVSVALGAFVAGLALAESDLAASVLGEVIPLRELFSTFFFVSVGILLRPGEIVEGLPVVLLLLALIVLAKAIPIAAIAWIGGHRPGAAVRTGALLGQSGEFSFVLATVALQLGVLDANTFSLAMGAVVLSVVLASPVYALGQRVADWLERAARLRPELSHLDQTVEPMHRHAVVLGYGRIGRTICRVLEARGFAWVAIDADYSLVRTARAGGAAVIFGDAGSPTILDEAGIGEAHTLVAAVNDPLATRQAADYARRRNPRIEIVARAHTDADEVELKRLGVARVVVADRELGNELLRHALRRFGVSDREIAAMLSARRG
jgi:CPA2 family monovalent cation:H+ antiporter-2